MKVGGQIPWNAIRICETFKISCLVGKVHTKEVLENHFKDQSFRLLHLLSITIISEKEQSRINLGLPGLFLGYAQYAGRIWKGDVLIADLAELETMVASEIYSNRLNAKEVIFPKQGEFIFPIEDGRIKTPGGDGQEDGVSKAGLQQAAAEPRGSRTCVCVNT